MIFFAFAERAEDMDDIVDDADSVTEAAADETVSDIY